MAAEAAASANTAGAGDVAPSGATSVQDILESMLSKKNLARDQYLASCMNPQMYISVECLLAHEQLASANATAEDVVSAAEKSTKLGLDDDCKMIRPLLKLKRTVVILRDAAEATTEEDVRGLIGGSAFNDKLRECRPEVNNTWFLKFDVDDVSDIVLWLRDKKLNGAQVNASIKSEHFMRSFFPLNVPPAQAFPGMPPNMDGLQAALPFPMPLGSPGGPPFPPGMPLPPPLPMLGPQQLGFWRPWGMRLQPAPITLVPQEKKPEAERSSGGKAKGYGKGKEAGKDGKGGKGKDWGKDSSASGYGSWNGKDGKAEQAGKGGKDGKAGKSGASGKGSKDGKADAAGKASAGGKAPSSGGGSRWVVKEAGTDRVYSREQVLGVGKAEPSGGKGKKGSSGSGGSEMPKARRIPGLPP
eukprot:TRINITY_DN92_c1_g2_i1.p1 TRINITY_DN92_c1_g2~~TRINITY_DN92_c1_g2_i1.p1  ORF type:complete len:414 (+),score=83.91 TRINITY_DN92_c1_g2_i1:148-1389(+)